MPNKTNPSSPRVVPAIRYHDVAAAAEWLCAAFGFKKHRLISQPDGAISRAELMFGANVIMLFPVGASDLDGALKQPDEIGGAETQTCYFVVEDADAHYRSAKAAGGEFVEELQEFENGGRGYSCRDPQGHVWTFGTYDPWTGMRSGGVPTQFLSGRSFRWAASLAAILAVVSACWILLISAQSGRSDDIKNLQAELTEARQTLAQSIEHAAQHQRERASLDVGLRQAREQLALEQSALRVLQRKVVQLEEQLVQERGAVELARQAVVQAVERGNLASAARSAAESRTRAVRVALVLTRSAKLRAEQSILVTGQQLLTERSAREAAERNSEETKALLASVRPDAKDPLQLEKEPAPAKVRYRPAGKVEKSDTPQRSRPVAPVIP